MSRPSRSAAACVHMEALGNGDLDQLFLATVEATEEAVIDSMLCAETMVGRDGNTAVALAGGRACWR